MFDSARKKAAAAMVWLADKVTPKAKKAAVRAPEPVVTSVEQRIDDVLDEHVAGLRGLATHEDYDSPHFKDKYHTAADVVEAMRSELLAAAKGP